MDNSTILHIYLVAHADAVDIATDNRIKPHAAAIAHHHIAYNGGIGCNKTSLAPVGCFVFYR